jgi:hypothetical protein
VRPVDNLHTFLLSQTDEWTAADWEQFEFDTDGDPVLYPQ